MRSVIGGILINNASYKPENDFSALPDVFSLHELPPDLQEQVIRTYKKMIVVRHPYDRLVSVFSSKLMPAHRSMMKATLNGKTKYINRYLTTIMGKKVDFNPAKDVLSFEQFVGVISSEYYKGFQNNHWNTMFEHCLPCNIKYDFILRLETLEKDYPILAYYLQPPRKLRESAPFLDQMKSILLDPEEKMFSLLWRYEHLGTDVLAGLRHIYENDLDVFGYTWHDQQGADCRIPLNDVTYCC